MLNKNDPLIGAVQEVMKKNQAEREAVKLVNEKFGVTDRKALPHEKQSAWDAAYKTVLSEGAEALAALAPPHNKVTKKDVLVGRGVLKKHPTEPGKHILAKEEGDPSKAIRGDDVTGGSSVTTVKSTANPTSITPADQSALKKKIQGIKEEMTDAEKAKREKIVMSMKKKMSGFKERYGKRAKDVMYATATKQAMKEAADSASSMPQARGQTTYGTSAMTGMPRRSAPADHAGTSAMTGMPSRSAPADRVGTSAVTGMPSASASTRQASTGAQIGGARPSPSVGGNAGALARQAAGQRTSNAIRNLNTPGLRTTNTVNAAGQAKGPNVGLPQKSTVASTGQKVNAATQTRGPNAASGAAPKPAAKAPVPTAKPVRPAAVAKQKVVAKPKTSTGAATSPVKKMSQAQRSYIARQKERQGP